MLKKLFQMLIVSTLCCFLSSCELVPKEEEDEDVVPNVSGNVVCENTTSGVKTCYDYSVDNTIPQSVVDQLCESLDNPSYPDSCVSTGSTGVCRLQTSGTSTNYFFNYRIYLNNATTEESTCTSAGGTWTAD